MPSLPFVNNQLWAHFSRGGGLAAMLAGWFSNWPKVDWLATLGSFFDTSDDYSRIVAGRNVSQLLLQQRNMDYLIPLRDLVTEMELSRTILYTRQTDHTIHTIYLYLLGVWFFDHGTAYRQVFSECHMAGEQDDRWIFDKFGLYWIFASLMHDVGYLFENITDETVKYRSAVDALFRVDTISVLQQHFPYCKLDNLQKASDIIISKITEWRDANKLPQYATANTPAKILQELDKAPWIQNFIDGADDTTSSLFRLHATHPPEQQPPSYKPSFQFLKAYANTVAKQGYVMGDQPSVDHAYASGLLLLQLTSLRYWMVCTINEQDPPLGDILSGSDSMDRWPGFGYKKEILINDIVTACHATAAHNVLKTVPGAVDELPYKLLPSPLVFFSVLCDELQKWHRFPVGKEWTLAPFDKPLPRESSMYLRLGSVWSRGLPGLGCDDSGIAYNMFDSVYERLCDDDLGTLFSFYGEHYSQWRTLQVLTK
jgi:hypothetical protein